MTRSPRKLRKTSVSTDVLTGAIAIVNACRRRQSRRETLRDIASIVALVIGVVLAIELALSIAAMPLQEQLPPAPFPFGAPSSAAAPKPF
jgi:hypothetical protein